MSNTNNGFSEFPIHKFMATLSEILSEKYGCKITIKAIPKEEYYAKLAQSEQSEQSEQKAG